MYQVLTLLTPLITAPYISRVLGVDQVGIYSFTLSNQYFFSLLAGLGTASYGLREIARNRDDAKMRSKLFWEIELLTVFTTAVMLCAWAVWIYFNQKYKIFYLILSLNLFNTMFDIAWFYDGLEMFQYTVFKNSAIKIAGVILLFTFIKSRDDLALYIFIVCATTLLGTLSMWVTLPKFLVPVDWRKFTFRRHLHETFIYFVPTVATSIYTVLDKTLIGFITKDASQNGYYEQATKLIKMMEALTFTALNHVLGSRISWLFAENRHEEIKRRILDSMNYIFFMGVGICFGILGIAANFVPVFFGPGYDGVIRVLQLLSPILVIIGVSNCLGSQYYNPAGLRAVSARFIIMGSVTNLVLNLLLIPVFKSQGAVIASLAAETLISVLYVRHSNGYLTPAQLVQLGWKKLVAGLVMLAGMVCAGRFVHGEITVIIAQFCVGVIIYLAVLAVLKDSFIRFALDTGSGMIYKFMHRK